MISNIKELIQKLTESENTISFVEKKELIENSIKNIYIEKISHINEKKIKDNNILIKSEKNILNAEQIHCMDGNSGRAVVAFISLFFTFLIPLFLIKDNFFIGILLFSTLGIFFSYRYRKKLDKIIKKQSDEYYDEKSLLPNQYMYKHYKNIVKETTVDFIKELELISEPELQKAKKYISDYLVVNTFEFEEGHTNNIFYNLSHEVKEKIFIPEEPLRSKKLLSTEVKNRIQNNKLTITNIEEIKLKLISDVDSKVISKMKIKVTETKIFGGLK